ncbi:MAG: FHA domain-containing protein [Planctomycetota bacterium]|jgi:pSer/pThr/pTyr-binding forkhead associated (FHA) protein/response regulator RpfG family c-di-GMP phosphodiesterase|nr:FHA domain-containing protein [Planctomycetota bacterium]
MPGIRVKNGPNQGQTCAIGDGRLSIGRDDGCTLPLLDKGASRMHAELFRIGDMCFIRDLDSKNGTFVNDVMVGEEMLRDGDRIQIGGTIFIFEAQTGAKPGDGLVFSEDDLENLHALSLEDLTSANVGLGDVSSEQHLRALYRLSHLAAGEDTEDSLIKKTLAFTAEALKTDGAYLFGRNQLDGSIVALGQHIPDGARAGGQLSRTIIRKVLQEKRALLITDAMRDDRFSANESVMRHHIHAVICAPVRLHDGIECALYLAGNDPAISFNEQELELAAAMAGQIGLSLANISARLLRREHLFSAVSMLLRVADVGRPGIQAVNERLAGYARSIGAAMRLGAEFLERLQLAALLHNYADMVEPDDGAPVEKRVDLTAKLLAQEAFLPKISDIVGNQLERFDGSGPKGLRGEEIPLDARIFHVALGLETERGASAEPEKLAEAVKTVSGALSGKYDREVIKAMLEAESSGILALTLAEQWRKRRSSRLSSLLNAE